MSAEHLPHRPTVHIRAYRPDDAERVRALTLEAFEYAGVDAAVDRRWPARLPVPWGERKWRSLRTELAGHPEDCFVAVATQVHFAMPLDSA